jgi:hypothetical protein
MELELPEDLVLPYEVTKPGFVPRTFYVPARALNQYLGTDGAIPLRPGNHGSVDSSDVKEDLD